MTRLLAPATFLMSRLRYPAKFTLIGLLFLTPLVLVMYFFQHEINTNIDFARNERDGVAYDLPVTQLLHDTLLHQQLAHTFSVDKSASESDLRTVEAKISEDIKTVDALDTRLGVSLKTSADWKKLKDKCHSVAGASLTANAKQALDAHVDLVNDIIAFIGTIGNNSQLILDPDLDSYYSMDIAVTQLPQVVQKLSMARDQAAEIACRHTITPDEKTDLTVLSGQISTPAGTAHSDLQQALAFNGRIKEKLEAGEKPFQASTTQFTDLLTTKLLKVKGVGAPSAEIISAGNAAIDAALSYHTTTAAILDDLLAKRLYAYETRRMWVDAIALVSLLFAVYLFLGFTARPCRVCGRCSRPQRKSPPGISIRR